jgi:hypothetical protein
LCLLFPLSFILPFFPFFFCPALIS